MRLTTARKVSTWLRTTWIPYVQRVPENLREEFIAPSRSVTSPNIRERGREIHVQMFVSKIDAIKFENLAALPQIPFTT